MNYIAVEGINGCGKTTLVKNIKDYYGAGATNGISTVKFPVNHKRDIEEDAMSEMSVPKMDAYIEMEKGYHKERMAVFDAYQQAKSAKPLISDRSFISSWVYSRATGMQHADIDALHDIERKKHTLLGVIYIDIDPKIAFRRIEKRGNALHTLEFLQSARTLYGDFLETLWDVPVLRVSGRTIDDDLMVSVRACLWFIQRTLTV